MHLDDAALNAWIDALALDPDAPVTVPASNDPWGPAREDATWRLSFYMTAYFYIPTDEARDQIVVGMPALYEQFDRLLGNPTTHEQHPKTGKVLRRGVKSSESRGITK